MMNKNIKLVLSGSGTLYPIHAGAIKAFEEYGYKIEEICGVSGGSIVAALYASNPRMYESKIKRIIPELDWDIFGILNKYGLIKGNKIKEQIAKNVEKTFRETEIPLTILTSNLSLKKCETFSSLKTPNENISEWVRASMSFPGIFQYVEKNGCIYVDGGLFSNFPIDIFGNNQNVFGVRIINKSKAQINSVFDYISVIANSAIIKSEIEDEEDAFLANVVNIETDNASMNLSLLKKENIEQLFNYGYEKTKKHLDSLQLKK